MSIDAQLKDSGNAKPRRGLRTDFTQTTINYIAAHPRRSWLPRPKEILMKLLDKPALTIAGLVVTVAISGTAYAAVVNWPNISAMFGGEQTTPGGRIVKVDTTNCRTDNAFTITKPKEQRGGPRYFKVKDGSTLTNEQITQMVLGNCEQGAQSDVSQAINKEIEKNPANKGTLVGGYIDNTITAISPTSITVEGTYPSGPQLVPFKHVFSRIDPEVIVYYKADKLAFSDLRVGDHISLAYRATGNALLHSETTPYNTLNTDEATIAVIVKNTPNITAAIDFQKYFGLEFEEVVACDKTPTGFCTVSEYHQQ